MHRIVEEHPTYRREVIERQAQHEKARSAHSKRHSKLATEYAEARKAYRAEVKRATLAGESPPEPPAKPRRLAAGDPEALAAEAEAVWAAERRFFREHADELEAALREREAELLSEVEEIAKQLRPALKEVEHLRSAIGQVRAATEGPRPHRGRIDLGELVRAAVSGGSFLTAGGLQRGQVRTAQVLDLRAGPPEGNGDGLVEVAKFTPEEEELWDEV